MNRPRLFLALCLSAALALSVAPSALATHNNQGTIKVHDDESENPDVRNVPHVDCDFWIEGFGMGDDSGWIEFYSWPPTGEFELVDSGSDQNWSADAGEASGEFHFLAGPFELPSGHWRVEVYTDDGHPGSDDGHFAKAKTFWVECEESPPENPPCPTGVEATAESSDGNATITLTWNAVADADGYAVYRASEGGDFELWELTTDTTFVDADVEAGVTYEYYVTAVVGDFESENCEIVEATAIPFFPSLAVGAIAVLGSLGAFVALRRKL